MKRSNLIVLALALVAAALLLLLLLPEDRSAEGVRPRAAESEVAARPSADLEAVPNAAAETVTTSTDAAPEVARTSVQREIAPEVVDENTLRVRVVDRESGAPVPGAEVRIATDDVLTPDTIGAVHEYDRLVEDAGTLATADGRGVARFPRPSDDVKRWLATAAKDDFWGYAFLDPSGDDLVVEVIADRALSVRVVDEGGEPQADVPVGLRYLRGSYPSRARYRAFTDNEGMATFAHIDHCLTREGDPVNWIVTLEVGSNPQIQHDFDDEELPAEPVTLALPSSARVVVTARFADGTPYARSGQIELGVVAPDEEQRQSPFGRRRPLVREELVDGRAVFTHVVPCDELELVLTRGQAAIASHTYVPGPRLGDVEHEVEVVIGGDHPVLRMRALDARREPIRDAELEVLTVWSTEYSDHNWSADARTDEDGVFSVDVSSQDVPVRVVVRRDAEGEAETIAGRTTLAASLAPGLHDLGEIVLVAERPFVAGRVVDATGAGVPEMNLWLQRFADGRQGTRWRQVNLHGTTDERGHFEVRGDSMGDRFRVGATGMDRHAAMVEFVPGVDDLILEATTTGRLAGSLLLREDVDPSRLWVWVEWPDEHTHLNLPYTKARTRPSDDGEFSLELPAGRFDVKVTGKRRDTLHWVEGVQVVGGETTRDPRLQEVDLRDSIFAYRVRLTTDVPDSSLGGSIVVSDPSAEDSDSYWFNVTGKETLLVTGIRPASLDIAVDGYRSVQVREAVDDELVVHLERSLPVRLVLVGNVELPEPPVYLKPVLVAEDGSGNIDWGGAPLNEDREAVTTAQSSGRLRVEWIVEKRDAFSASAYTETPDPAEYLEIEDVPGEQRFEVHLTAEQLEAMLARAREL